MRESAPNARPAPWAHHTGLRLLFVLLVACAGCRTPSPPPPERVIGEDEPYVIGVPDEVEVRVWRNPELSVVVQVRADGKISVPLVDDVQAEGLTPEELKAVITEQLGEYVASPDVTVIVTKMNSKTAAVLGAVGRSGLVSLLRNTRVIDAIAQSGGFTPYARKNRVRILRDGPDGTQIEYRFDYGKFIDGAAPESNILLEPGDTVVVPD